MKNTKFYIVGAIVIVASIVITLFLSADDSSDQGPGPAPTNDGIKL